MEKRGATNFHVEFLHMRKVVKSNQNAKILNRKLARAG